MGLKPLGTALGNLQSKSGNASVRRASDDRMTLSEAIEAVGLMIDCYPQGRAQLTDSYIGNIAALLCEYPRGVAMECIDPRRGVMRETKFLPTVADIVQWCEPRATREHTFVDRSAQAEQQIADRRKWLESFTPQVMGGSHIANLRVRPDRPGYAEVVERSKYSRPEESIFEADGTIWVPRQWHEERHSWRPPQAKTEAA